MATFRYEVLTGYNPVKVGTELGSSVAHRVSETQLAVDTSPGFSGLEYICFPDTIDPREPKGK